MKRLFLSIFVFSFLIPEVFSVPLENLISPSYAERLRAGGEIVIETQFKNPVPLLLPQNNELRQAVTGALGAKNHNMLVEALYLYKKPVPFNRASGSWDSGQKAKIFNQMTALSTLTGIQYFSASRNAMRTFYEYSSVIDSPTTKKPLADPVFAQPPASLSIFARQKDLTFGDNIYRYEYVSAEDVIFFSQENITALNYGVITAIGRGNLCSVMAVFDCGDSILIYAVSMAKAASVPGMQNRVGNSFTNRAEAILKWFTGRLDNELFVE